MTRYAPDASPSPMTTGVCSTGSISAADRFHADDVLAKARRRAYAMREDGQGYDAKLIEDLISLVPNAALRTRSTQEGDKG